MSARVSTTPADTGTAAAFGRSWPALSPSRATDFKQCPLKYRLRAIDRIPEPPTRQAVRGSVVHAVLEELYGLPADQRLPERANALAEPASNRILAEQPEAADLFGEGEWDGFLDEVCGLLRTYYRLEDPTSFDPESTETRIEVDVPDGGPSLRGFVDRIDVAPNGAVRVVDYKTGRSPGPKRETKALFQPKFYALMLLRDRAIVADQLQLIYLADGQILTYVPDEDELHRFERTVIALWQAVREAGETGNFRPNRSWLCGYCAYQRLCPEFNGSPPPYPGWPDRTAGTVTESVSR